MSTVRRVRIRVAIGVCLGGMLVAGSLFVGGEPSVAPVAGAEPLYLDPLSTTPPHLSTDSTIKYDYDIVYVRAVRRGDDGRTLWPDIAHPSLMDPGADLMLLHPDGTEEVLVEGGQDGAVTDPAISLDGRSVFYSHIQGLAGTSPWGQSPRQGADLFKMDLKTREVVRLTKQEFTPNLGAANWAPGLRRSAPGRTHLEYGVLNLGACPLPGGRLAFVSNRNAFRPPKHSSPCLQLFVMDDDGRNVEQIGHLNIGMALHPVVLTDGRIMFSSLESQGLRSSILWGLWHIDPDGSQWGPLVSAFRPGDGAPNAFHFQAQLSDRHIVAEEYYNQNNSGFGGYYKFPVEVPGGYAGFGPAWTGSPRNPPLRNGRFDNGHGIFTRLAFSPYGIEAFTPFATYGEGPANPSVRGDKTSTKVGKFTHPAAAPDNGLLTVWSPGPVNHQYTHLPMPDGGIYLIPKGLAVEEPGALRLVKNDPKYNEQFPRAVVPYRRIYGIDEPARRPGTANDGSRSKHLPAGTPFGLVGTSSFSKRESYPNGAVPEGGITAGFAGGRKDSGYGDLDPFNTSENGASLNWVNQGSDAGRYDNADIHAVRILAMEPTTDRHRGEKSGRLFHSHAMERLRILGEVPLRKFEGGKQPLDPDGQPDTSFLAKIPADVAFTFQTLDRRGMVLNYAQTWHQLRPGEVRHDCGGCHAHSQQPTPFEKTFAARPDAPVWDLATKTPLVTSKAKDESGKRWDEQDASGLRTVSAGAIDVEYHRHIKPILQRSCAACHTSKDGKEPAAKLDLDADDALVAAENVGRFPGTYYRLALDGQAQFGHKPVIANGTWRGTNASRYVRKFQSRRSLLAWKVLGERTDGWSNDDFPTETEPGNADTLQRAGEAVPNTRANQNLADLDYVGSPMPPPDAVAAKKVQPLSDEDRLTLVRWIDLGCPIDLDFRPEAPEIRGFGWMCDDNRPTLALTEPRRGANTSLSRILVGMFDYGTGIDDATFRVEADFDVDDVPAGRNLAPKFVDVAPGVKELKLTRPIADLTSGTLWVEIRDKQGNATKIERTFSIRPQVAAK